MRLSFTLIGFKMAPFKEAISMASQITQDSFSENSHFAKNRQHLKNYDS